MRRGQFAILATAVILPIAFLPVSPFSASSASSAPLRWVYVVDAEDVGLRSSELDEMFGEVVALQQPHERLRRILQSFCNRFAILDLDLSRRFEMTIR